MQTSLPLDPFHAGNYLGTYSPPGAVTLEEARVLADLIIQNRLKSCLEIGVANGGSALAIAQAAESVGGIFEGIDPCQTTEHQDAALKLLNKFGLGGKLKVHTQPTHLAAPKLLEAGRQFDFIFVDGMHCFEFKCLDAFYSDRLLQVGGFLLFHDAYFPSTKKVLRLLQTTGRYQMIPTPTLHVGLRKRLRLIAGALVKMKKFSLSWPNGFSNLYVLRKVSNVEVAWNFYSDF
jgi:predicted O-methyltransferase YrrM